MRRGRPWRRFTITKDSNGQHYGNVTSGNGQVIAIGGEGFPTLASARTGDNASQTDAATATDPFDTR